MDETKPENNTTLFDKIRYYLINSKNKNIGDLLKNNGAIEDRYLTSQITHVICDDSDHSEYNEAKELFELTVVKSDWVLMSLYAQNLLPVDAFSPESNRLFSKILAININLEDNLAKKIQAMLNYYGGFCISDSNENCTHALATSYDANIFEKLKLITNNKIKFITPDWIIDCIEQNKLIDETDYNPIYLITNLENQNLLLNQNNNEIEKDDLTKLTTTNNSPTIDYEQINKQQQIKGRNYILQSDNFFNQNTNESLFQESTNKTTNENANNITNTEQTAVLLQSQQTPNSKSKAKKSRNKSNLTTNQINNQTCQSNNNTNNNKNKNGQTTTTTTTSSSSSTFNFDMNEIFQSVIGEAMNISIRKPKPILLELIEHTNNIHNSNNNNNNNNSNKKDSNEYSYFDDNDQNNTLFSLYNETYYTQENSHLIKFNNCLLGCVFYLKDFENYYSKETLFEWKKLIENYCGKIVDDYDVNIDQITHVLCANRYSNIYKTALKDEKRIVTQFWLEDVLEEEKLKPPWRAYHFPSIFERENGPLKNHIIALHGFREKERLILKTLIYLLNGKFTSYLTKANSLLISTSDKGAKLDKAKEWNIPIVNGIWLMELYLGNSYALNDNLEERYKVLDIDHFAYDAIFIQDLMKPWKTLIKLPIEKIKDISNQDGFAFKSPLKRSQSISNRTEATSSKKVKFSNDIITWQKPQSNIPIVMFTGVNISDLIQYQKDIISLGGVVSKQPHQTTHLIVNNIDRTAKLLKCLNYCDYVINLNWLIDSKIEGKFLDPNLYIVKNEEFEMKYNCNMKESIDRAKQNGPLFTGFKFYLSPNTRPSIDELSEIIKSAGGQVIRTIPTLKHINEETDKKYNHSKYILISSVDDLNLFDGMIEKDIPIYNEEFVLSSVLQQKFEPNIYRLK